MIGSNKLKTSWPLVYVSTLKRLVWYVLRHGLFTIGALDNLDHNPFSTTTAMDSFHGNLFQLSSSSSGDENPTARDCRQRNLQLPDDTTVPAVALAKASVDVPEPPNSIQHNYLWTSRRSKKTGEVLARTCC